MRKGWPLTMLLPLASAFQQAPAAITLQHKAVIQVKLSP